MQRLGFIIFICLLVAPTVALAQDKLPEGAIARLGVHRMRVDRPILDSAFAPDGRTFVVVCDEKDGRPNVILFDVASGLERKRLDIFGARHIAMARHKPLMAVDANQHLEVWDLSTEKRLKQWDAPIWKGKASALAISRDGGHVVAAGEANGKSTLHRWNAATGAELWNVSIPGRRVDTLSVSDDGRKILTAIAFEYNYGELDSVKEPLFWLAQFGGVKGLFVYNAWMLGYEYQKPVPSIAIWDAKTGKKLSEMLNEADSCVFSPDGTMAARQTRQGGELWRLEPEPKMIAELARHEWCEFTPDGKQFVLGGGDLVQRGDIFQRQQGIRWPITLWDIAKRQSVRRFETEEMARGLRVSPDGKLLAVLHQDFDLDRYWFVEFSDLTTGKAKRFPAGHPGIVEGLAFSPDGKRLATFSRDTLLLHDVKTGAELRRWIGHDKSIKRIAFSPDGKVLVSAAADASIALWDASTGVERARMTAKNHAATLAFTPDGKTLLTAAQDKEAWLEQWDVATGKAGTARLLPHDAHTSVPALAPTADWLAYFDSVSFGGLTPELRVWPTRIGHPALAPPKEGDRGARRVRSIGLTRHAVDEERTSLGTRAYGFAFSADGKLLATSDSAWAFLSDPVVRVWETATQRELLRFHTLPIETDLLALSPDGRTLAHGSGERRPLRERNVDEVVFLHDLSAVEGGVGIRKRALRGHLGSITCLAFAQDSKLVATGGSDGIVYVFRVDQIVQPNPVPEWKKDLAELWPILADANPAKAHRALAQLELRPKESLVLLRAHLKPAVKLDAKVLAQHVRDLANANFAVRQQASVVLEDAGEQAVPLLQQALKKPSSLEVKRRMETLLDQIDRPLESPSQIRAYRALMLLERLGTPDARMLLEELAQGQPTAWLSVEARHSLERLRHRP